MLGRRPENDLDLDEVYAVAVETGVALEINGLPDRLDLSSAHARDALAAGVDLVCSTDAHSVEGLGNMELSVVTARRAAAPRGRVVNTRPLAEILR
jgi:DNA polymerase (family 10)